jgi:predicted hotdog family 3-hydroxylacyl-ACP dehydratase
VRGTYHRANECLFDDIDRYDDDFWEQVFKRTEAIMAMPENNQVTYPE